MTSLIFLQIIAPLAFIYGIRQKMWVSDTIGFVVICFICAFLVLHDYINSWFNFHMIAINLLIVFIVVFHHYHRIRFYCDAYLNKKG